MSPPGEGGPDAPADAQPHLTETSDPTEAGTAADSSGGGSPGGDGQPARPLDPRWNADPNDYPPGVDFWEWRLYACGIGPDPRLKGRRVNGSGRTATGGNGQPARPPNVNPNDVPPGVDYWDWRWYAFGQGPDPRVKGQRVNGTATPAARPAGDPSAWAQAVFNGEVEKVATAPSGSRNDILNSSALRLYRVALAGALDSDTVTDALTDAGRTASGNGPEPFTDGEIQGTLRSAFNGALREGPATDVPQPYDPTEYGTPAGEPGGDDTQDGERVDWRERGIEIELDKLRIRHEARRRLDNENRPPITYPAVRSLTAMLAEPDTPDRYLIEGLAPVDARIMLSAQYKAGKTTLVANLMRSLVDEEPFLGRFPVNTPARGVVLIDDEMSENMLRAWLRDQNIDNTGAVADVITLRGNVAAFNLLDPQCHAYWVQRLRDVGCDYLILDCLRPVLDALGLDENHDAGRFLVAFDALLNQAAIPDAAVVHHMGHANERARGDSRLQDWPDATWRLVRENDDPASARFFTAYGRGVNVAEGRLTFDPATLRMRYAAGSRHSIKVDDAAAAIIRLLARNAKDGDDGMSGNAIEGALGGEHPRSAVRDALKRLLSACDGPPRVAVKAGRNNAKLHHIVHPCADCGLPVITGRPRHESCPPEDGGMPL